MMVLKQLSTLPGKGLERFCSGRSDEIDPSTRVPALAGALAQDFAPRASEKCHGLARGPPRSLYRLTMNPFAEFEGGGDVVKYFVNAAGSGERQRAEAEHPAEHALLHRNRFDLAEQQFQCAPAQEADFDNHSFRRDAEFGGLVIDECTQCERQADARYGSR